MLSTIVSLATAIIIIASMVIFSKWVSVVIGSIAGSMSLGLLPGLGIGFAIWFIMTMIKEEGKDETSRSKDHP